MQKSLYLSFLLLAPCAYGLLQSGITVNNFTSNYSMEYFNYKEQEDAPRKLRITLRSHGLNKTELSANNTEAYYMGLALGSDDLINTTYVTCEYLFNATEPNIICK